MSVIFHVEDESSVRLLYKEVFEEQGFEIIQASDAEEALRMLKSNKPDVIILDLKMPGIGGRGFLERFHRMKLKIPLVISSAYPYLTTDQSTLPFDAFVVKSGDLTELVNTVRQLVDRLYPL
ncbi:MAG: response regulator [Desulfomonilaceae bacterium]